MRSLDVGELLVCEQTQHWGKTLVEGEIAVFFFFEKKKINDPDSNVTFSLETKLSHDGPRRSRSKVISASQ